MSSEARVERIYTAFFEEPYPADLKAAALWLAASILAIYLPVLDESPLRVLLTLPALLFLPGYCLIAAVFPKDSDVDLIERIALSFGLSIAVVPLAGDPDECEDEKISSSSRCKRSMKTITILSQNTSVIASIGFLFIREVLFPADP